MAKDDPNDMAAWTGQGIAHYSGQKRRDVVSVFCRGHHQQRVNLPFLTIWLECLNIQQTKWVILKEKYGSGSRKN
jgi:hypothetical protein